jgi:phage FluMu protein Com
MNSTAFRSIIWIVISVLLVTAAIAAVYTYKCPRCGVIVQYDRPGVYKCAKDNLIMTPVQK